MERIPMMMNSLRRLLESGDSAFFILLLSANLKEEEVRYANRFQNPIRKRKRRDTLNAGEA